MLTILQARLQQHISLEIADVQTGVRKERNHRSNWKHPSDHGKSKIILKKKKKNLFCFIDIKVHYVDHNKLQKIFKDLEI